MGQVRGEFVTFELTWRGRRSADLRWSNQEVTHPGDKPSVESAHLESLPPKL